MTVEECFLGVEKAEPIDATLRAASNFMTVVDDPPAHAFVWLQPAARTVELRWFGLLGSQLRAYGIDALAKSLASDLPGFVLALHDETNGVYLFERYVPVAGEDDARCDLRLLSDVGRLGVAVGKIAAAPTTPANAIEVGLAQTYPTEAATYLGARSGAEIYPLGSTETRRITIPPSPMRPVIRVRPPDAYWGGAGLPPRSY